MAFTKTYDDHSRAHHRVEYEGVVGAEGNEIHGRWTIARHWSGTFIMIRSERASTGIERRVAERVS